MSLSGSDIAFRNNLCECYKKLQLLGVPLYKNEEDEHYAEGYGEIPYESAFQLPGVLTIVTQIPEYPIVDDGNLPDVFRHMAQVIPNLSDFDLNVLSFWILDMFVEGLWTAQKAGMNHDHQRATLLWIASHFESYDGIFVHRMYRTTVIWSKINFIQIYMFYYSLGQDKLEYSFSKEYQFSRIILDHTQEFQFPTAFLNTAAAKYIFSQSLCFCGLVKIYVQKAFEGNRLWDLAKTKQENPSRKDLFNHLKIVLFKIDLKKNEYSGEETRMDVLTESGSSLKEPSADNPSIDDYLELPLPPGTIDVNTESDISPIEDLTVSETTSQSEVNGEGEIMTSAKKPGAETVTERNVRHMKIILDILYRIFARLWVFLEIQAVFHAMPAVEQVDLPFRFNVPKPAPKIDPFAPPKVGRKTAVLEERTPEMEKEKELHKNDFILPLQAAEESKAYLKQIYGQSPSDRSIFSKGKDKKK